MDVLRSNGEDEMRVYAKLDLPPRRVEPEVKREDRVQLTDPRQTSTARRSARRAGPRNPQARTLPPAETARLAVELPDGLPMTKAQRIVLDPAVVARWRAEARQAEQDAAKKEGS